MRNLKWVAAVAILSGAVSAGSAFADTADLNSCVDLGQQVKAALAANPQSPNYQAAFSEEKYGRDFCTNSFYQRGVDHYDHALALLGTAPSKD